MYINRKKVLKLNVCGRFFYKTLYYGLSRARLAFDSSQNEGMWQDFMISKIAFFKNFP